MGTEVITNLLIFVPASYFFGIYLEGGLRGAWAALILYTTLYLIFMFIKFFKGNWQNLKKI